VALPVERRRRLAKRYRHPNRDEWAGEFRTESCFSADCRQRPRRRNRWRYSSRAYGRPGALCWADAPCATALLSANRRKRAVERRGW